MRSRHLRAAHVEGCFVPTRSRSRPAGSWRPRPLTSSLITTINAGTGQDLDETILNPSNVNSTDFGKEFTDAVDGAIYAQPLYMAQGVHNVVLVATENDSVSAFDADNPGPASGTTA